MGRRKRNVSIQSSKKTDVVQMPMPNHETRRNLNTFAMQGVARTTNIVEASHKIAGRFSEIQNLLSHNGSQENPPINVHPLLLGALGNQFNHIAPNVNSVVRQVGNLSVGIQQLQHNLQQPVPFDAGTIRRLLIGFNDILDNIEDQMLPLSRTVTHMTSYLDQPASQTAIQSDRDDDAQSVEEIPLEGNDSANKPNNIDDLINKRAKP